MKPTHTIQYKIAEKKNKNSNSKCTHVHYSTIYNSQDVETSEAAIIDETVKKLWHIYTMEYYSAIKDSQILPLVTTWMDFEGIMLSEISQRMTYTIMISCQSVNQFSH